MAKSTAQIPMRKSTLILVLLTMFTASFSSLDARADGRASEFFLANGMQVVVIPDHRAPVITHMVWYRVGAADETRGVSGIAHFLEHLMFKGTNKIPPGEFSKIVARQGGQDNAFTTHDVTAYFQRVAKDRLPLVMQMESDRMVNLVLDEKNVLTERDVILEERRSRTENNPSALLDEQMGAMLYQNHPYHMPVIGWMHEIAKLSRQDALDFYKSHYAPNNAILVVAGDVTTEEVKKLAEDTYGKLPSNPAIKPRQRPSEPPSRAPKRIELKDPRAGNPTLYRSYLAPSYSTAEPGEAEALELMMKVMGGGATSRMYKQIVVEKHMAPSTGAYYSGGGLDSGKIGFYAVAPSVADLDKIEAEIDGMIATLIDKGVTDAELNLAKKAYLAEHIQESDNQSSLARRYGFALTTGQKLKDIEEWPDRLKKIGTEDIVRVAKKHLDIKASVTGRLIPQPVPAESAGNAPGKPAAPKT